MLLALPRHMWCAVYGTAPSEEPFTCLLCSLLMCVGPPLSHLTIHGAQLHTQEPVTKEVCILFAMLIFLRLCVYYSLQYKTTFKKKQ